jgi:hypothetical protein
MASELEPAQIGADEGVSHQAWLEDVASRLRSWVRRMREGVALRPARFRPETAPVSN